MKLAIGDTVLITSGKDKGQTGSVARVIPRAFSVIVEGKNMFTKHVKPRGSTAGEIIRKERPVPVARVAMICPHCKQQTRVGFQIGKNGAKERVCKKCQKSLPRKSS